MLVTFRVALHYVLPDNYHVFISSEVVELELSSKELDAKLVEICRDSFVLLRAYSLGIESTGPFFMEKSCPGSRATLGASQLLTHFL